MRCEISSQIAEFYAKVTADTTQIQASLSRLEDRLVKTKEQTTKAGGVFDALKGHIGGLINPTSLAIGAFTAITGAVASSFNEFQKYADQVRQVSQISGTTAEETSRLLQVLDDFGVTAEDVTIAARAMKEKGLSPTVDTLADLSAQFLAIEDPAKRFEFAQDNLGKSASKYFDILSKGPDFIRENADAVSDSLILNDKQIQQAEDQRLALDAVSDAWQGLKLKTGQYVGSIILTVQAAEDGKDAIKAYADEHGILIRNQHQAIEISNILRERQEAINGQMDRGAAMTKLYNEQLGITAEKAEDAGSALEEFGTTYGDLLSITENIGSEQQGYNQSQDELIAKQATIKAQIDALIKQGYTPLNKKVQELQGEYDDLGKQSTQLATEHQAAMQQIQYDMLVTKLSADGLTSAEYDLAIQAGETLGIFDKSSANAARAMNKLTDEVVKGKLRVQDLNQALRMMEDHQYSIAVVLNILANHVSQGEAYEEAGIVSGQAGGGDLPLGKGWAAVGDAPGGVWTPWTELISPEGKVIDAKTSRMMRDAGIVKGIQNFSVPDDGMGGGGGGTVTTTSGTGTKGDFTNPGKDRDRDEGGGLSTLGGFDTTAAEVMPADAVSESTAVAMQVAQQVQQAMKEYVSMAESKFDELIGVLKDENPRAIAGQIRVEFARTS